MFTFVDVTNISLYACNKNQVYIKEGLIQFLNCRFQSDEQNYLICVEPLFEQVN